MHGWRSKVPFLWRGTRDLSKAAIFLDREKGYYDLPLGLPAIFVILVFVGLARDVLEVILLRSMPESARWYSLSPNKLFAVSLWPFQFCFLSAGVTSLLGVLFARRIDKPKLAALYFYLQGLNLVAPFLDWVGNVVLRLPYHFLAPADAVTDWFAYTSKMFLGDFVALALYLLLPYRFLVRDFGLSRLQSAVAQVVVLNVLYWPNVHCFSTFNMIFKYCTGRWDAHWIGWGLYSLAAGLLGCLLLNLDRVVPRLRQGAQDDAPQP